MKTKNACMALAAVLTLGAGAPAVAHHAFSMYDATVYQKVSGTVKSYTWANPHTMVAIATKGPDGKELEWLAECSPVNMLRGKGWTAKSLAPGDKVDFVLHPNRNGVPYGLLVSATKGDGTILKDKD